MQSPFHTLGRLGLALIAAAGMTACAEKEALERYPIGGTVSGLVGTVVLQNNGGDDLSVEGSGQFRFTHAVTRGDGYNVTILTQPAGQTCNVANGSGVAAAEVVDVTVICTGASTTTYAIGGTVSGLTGEVVLRNVGENLAVSANGPFTFVTRVPTGTPYVVAVVTQPVGQVCRVSNNTGTVGIADVTDVVVTCTDTVQPTYTIGGTVSGLAGQLVLLTGTQNVTVSTNGVFAFPTPVPAGTAYAVTVATQPAGQTCTVANGSGTVGSANVTSVAITCANNTTPTNFYSIGGTVSGLKGDAVLRNGTADLTVGNGPFAFPTTVQAGTGYAVSVAAQPAGQTCTVTNGSGTVGTANVTSIVVTCTDNPPPSYSIGGTVSGLSGGTLRLGLESRPSPGSFVDITADGPFSFDPVKVEAGDNYTVSVLTQPAGQTCSVSNDKGRATGNVTNVVVSCVANVVNYSVGGAVNGLSGGTLELRLEHPGGGHSVNITTSGPFSFDPNKVKAGDSYSVSVVTQPADQTCSVTNGSGSANANVTNVAVSCVANVVNYSVGGNVTGLSGGTLELRLEYAAAGSSVQVTANGPFSFDPVKVAAGDTYTVSVLTQPTDQTCTVTNGSGTATANVTNVAVNCVGNVARYSVGGTIEGLTGSGLTIEHGGTNAVSPEPGATTFTLPEEFDDAAVFDVGISSQPTGQTCVITRAHGAIAAEDVTQVRVTCIANDTDPLVGTYAVSRDGEDTLAYLTLFASGVYIYGSVENDAGCGGALTGNGVEYGVYGFDQNTAAFTIRSAVVDTNGACGVWDGASSRFTGVLVPSGKGPGKGFFLVVSGGAGIALDPVESKNGQLFGSFADPLQKNVWLFEDAGGGAVVFFNTQTQADEGSTSLGHQAGVEYGCGTIVGSPDSGTLLPDLSASCQAPAPNVAGAVDTNGTSGLSHVAGPWTFVVNGDQLTSTTFRGSRVPTH